MDISEMAEMFSLLLFLMLIGYTLRYLILSRTLSPSCHLNSSWSPTHTSKCTPQLRRLFACLLVCVLVTPGVAENDLSIILQSVVDNGTGYTMDWGIYLNDLNVGFKFNQARNCTITISNRPPTPKCGYATFDFTNASRDSTTTYPSPNPSAKYMTAISEFPLYKQGWTPSAIRPVILETVITTAPQSFYATLKGVRANGNVTQFLSQGDFILNDCLKLEMVCYQSGEKKRIPATASDNDKPYYRELDFPSISPRRLHAFGYLHGGSFVNAPNTQALLSITAYESTNTKTELGMDFTGFLSLDLSRLTTGEVEISSLTSRVNATVKRSSDTQRISVTPKAAIDCSTGCVYNIPVLVGSALNFFMDKIVSVPMYFGVDVTDAAALAAAPRYMIEINRYGSHTFGLIKVLMPPLYSSGFSQALGASSFDTQLQFTMPNLEFNQTFFHLNFTIDKNLALFNVIDVSGITVKVDQRPPEPRTFQRTDTSDSIIIPIVKDVDAPRSYLTVTLPVAIKPGATVDGPIPITISLKETTVAVGVKLFSTASQVIDPAELKFSQTRAYGTTSIPFNGQYVLAKGMIIARSRYTPVVELEAVITPKSGALYSLSLKGSYPGNYTLTMAYAVNIGSITCIDKTAHVTDVSAEEKLLEFTLTDSEVASGSGCSIEFSLPTSEMTIPAHVSVAKFQGKSASLIYPLVFPDLIASPIVTVSFPTNDAGVMEVQIRNPVKDLPLFFSSFDQDIYVANVAGCPFSPAAITRESSLMKAQPGFISIYQSFTCSFTLRYRAEVIQQTMTVNYGDQTKTITMPDVTVDSSEIVMEYTVQGDTAFFATKTHRVVMSLKTGSLFASLSSLPLHFNFTAGEYSAFQECTGMTLTAAGSTTQASGEIAALTQLPTTVTCLLAARGTIYPPPTPPEYTSAKLLYSAISGPLTWMEVVPVEEVTAPESNGDVTFIHKIPDEYPDQQDNLLLLQISFGTQGTYTLTLPYPMTVYDQDPLFTTCGATISSDNVTLSLDSLENGTCDVYLLPQVTKNTKKGSSEVFFSGSGTGSYVNFPDIYVLPQATFAFPYVTGSTTEFNPEYIDVTITDPDTSALFLLTLPANTVVTSSCPELLVPITAGTSVTVDFLGGKLDRFVQFSCRLHVAYEAEVFSGDAALDYGVQKHDHLVLPMPQVKTLSDKLYLSHTITGENLVGARQTHTIVMSYTHSLFSRFYNPYVVLATLDATYNAADTCTLTASTGDVPILTYTDNDTGNSLQEPLPAGTTRLTLSKMLQGATYTITCPFYNVYMSSVAGTATTTVSHGTALKALTRTAPAVQLVGVAGKVEIKGNPGYVGDKYYLLNFIGTGRGTYVLDTPYPVTLYDGVASTCQQHTLTVGTQVTTFNITLSSYNPACSLSDFTITSCTCFLYFRVHIDYNHRGTLDPLFPAQSKLIQYLDTDYPLDNEGDLDGIELDPSGGLVFPPVYVSPTVSFAYSGTPRAAAAVTISIKNPDIFNSVLITSVADVKAVVSTDPTACPVNTNTAVSFANNAMKEFNVTFGVVNTEKYSRFETLVCQIILTYNKEIPAGVVASGVAYSFTEVDKTVPAPSVSVPTLEFDPQTFLISTLNGHEISGYNFPNATRTHTIKVKYTDTLFYEISNVRATIDTTAAGYWQGLDCTGSSAFSVLPSISASGATMTFAKMSFSIDETIVCRWYNAISSRSFTASENFAVVMTYLGLANRATAPLLRSIPNVGPAPVVTPSAVADFAKGDNVFKMTFSAASPGVYVVTSTLSITQHSIGAGCTITFDATAKKITFTYDSSECVFWYQYSVSGLNKDTSSASVFIDNIYVTPVPKLFDMPPVYYPSQITLQFLSASAGELKLDIVNVADVSLIDVAIVTGVVPGLVTGCDYSYFSNYNTEADYTRSGFQIDFTTPPSRFVPLSCTFSLKYSTLLTDTFVAGKTVSVTHGGQNKKLNLLAMPLNTSTMALTNVATPLTNAAWGAPIRQTHTLHLSHSYYHRVDDVALVVNHKDAIFHSLNSTAVASGYSNTWPSTLNSDGLLTLTIPSLKAGAAVSFETVVRNPYSTRASVESSATLTVAPSGYAYTTNYTQDATVAPSLSVTVEKAATAVENDPRYYIQFDVDALGNYTFVAPYGVEPDQDYVSSCVGSVNATSKTFEIVRDSHLPGVCTLGFKVVITKNTLGKTMGVSMDATVVVGSVQFPPVYASNPAVLLNFPDAVSGEATLHSPLTTTGVSYTVHLPPGTKVTLDAACTGTAAMDATSGVLTISYSSTLDRFMSYSCPFKMTFSQPVPSNRVATSYYQAYEATAMMKQRILTTADIFIGVFSQTNTETSPAPAHLCQTDAPIVLTKSLVKYRVPFTLVNANFHAMENLVLTLDMNQGHFSAFAGCSSVSGGQFTVTSDFLSSIFTLHISSVLLNVKNEIECSFRHASMPLPASPVRKPTAVLSHNNLGDAPYSSSFIAPTLPRILPATAPFFQAHVTSTEVGVQQVELTTDTPGIYTLVIPFANAVQHVMRGAAVECPVMLTPSASTPGATDAVFTVGVENLFGACILHYRLSVTDNTAPISSSTTLKYDCFTNYVSFDIFKVAPVIAMADPIDGEISFTFKNPWVQTPHSFTLTVPPSASLTVNASPSCSITSADGGVVVGSMAISSLQGSVSCKFSVKHALPIPVETLIIVSTSSNGVAVTSTKPYQFEFNAASFPMNAILSGSWVINNPITFTVDVTAASYINIVSNLLLELRVTRAGFTKVISCPLNPTCTNPQGCLGTVTAPGSYSCEFTNRLTRYNPTAGVDDAVAVLTYGGKVINSVSKPLLRTDYPRITTTTTAYGDRNSLKINSNATGEISFEAPYPITQPIVDATSLGCIGSPVLTGRVVRMSVTKNLDCVVEYRGTATEEISGTYAPLLYAGVSVERIQFPAHYMPVVVTIALDTTGGSHTLILEIQNPRPDPPASTTVALLLHLNDAAVPTLQEAEMKLSSRPQACNKLVQSASIATLTFGNTPAPTIPVRCYINVRYRKNGVRYWRAEYKGVKSNDLEVSVDYPANLASLAYSVNGAAAVSAPVTHTLTATVAANDPLYYGCSGLTLSLHVDKQNYTGAPDPPSAKCTLSGEVGDITTTNPTFSNKVLEVSKPLILTCVYTNGDVVENVHTSDRYGTAKLQYEAQMLQKTVVLDPAVQFGAWFTDSPRTLHVISALPISTAIGSKISLDLPLHPDYAATFTSTMASGGTCAITMPSLMRMEITRSTSSPVSIICSFLITDSVAGINTVPENPNGDITNGAIHSPVVIPAFVRPPTVSVDTSALPALSVTVKNSLSSLAAPTITINAALFEDVALIPNEFCTSITRAIDVVTTNLASNIPEITQFTCQYTARLKGTTLTASTFNVNYGGVTTSATISAQSVQPSDFDPRIDPVGTGATGTSFDVKMYLKLKATSKFNRISDGKLVFSIDQTPFTVIQCTPPLETQSPLMIRAVVTFSEHVFICNVKRPSTATPSAMLTVNVYATSAAPTPLFTLQSMIGETLLPALTSTFATALGTVDMTITPSVPGFYSFILPKYVSLAIPAQATFYDAETRQVWVYQSTTTAFNLAVTTTEYITASQWPLWYAGTPTTPMSVDALYPIPKITATTLINPNDRVLELHVTLNGPVSPTIAPYPVKLQHTSDNALQIDLISGSNCLVDSNISTVQFQTSAVACVVRLRFASPFSTGAVVTVIPGDGSYQSSFTVSLPEWMVGAITGSVAVTKKDANILSNSVTTFEYTVTAVHAWLYPDSAAVTGLQLRVIQDRYASATSCDSSPQSNNDFTVTLSAPTVSCDYTITNKPPPSSLSAHSVFLLSADGTVVLDRKSDTYVATHIDVSYTQPMIADPRLQVSSTLVNSFDWTVSVSSVSWAWPSGCGTTQGSTTTGAQTSCYVSFTTPSTQQNVELRWVYDGVTYTSKYYFTAPTGSNLSLTRPASTASHIVTGDQRQLAVYLGNYVASLKRATLTLNQVIGVELLAGGDCTHVIKGTSNTYTLTIVPSAPAIPKCNVKLLYDADQNPWIASVDYNNQIGSTYVFDLRDLRNSLTIDVTGTDVGMASRTATSYRATSLIKFKVSFNNANIPFLRKSSAGVNLSSGTTQGSITGPIGGTVYSCTRGVVSAQSSLRLTIDEPAITESLYECFINVVQTTSTANNADMSITISPFYAIGSSFIYNAPSPPGLSVTAGALWKGSAIIEVTPTYVPASTEIQYSLTDNDTTKNKKLSYTYDSTVFSLTALPAANCQSLTSNVNVFQSGDIRTIESTKNIGNLSGCVLYMKCLTTPCRTLDPLRKTKHYPLKLSMTHYAGANVNYTLGYYFADNFSSSPASSSTFTLNVPHPPLSVHVKVIAPPSASSAITIAPADFAPALVAGGTGCVVTGQDASVSPTSLENDVQCDLNLFLASFVYNGGQYVFTLLGTPTTISFPSLTPTVVLLSPTLVITVDEQRALITLSTKFKITSDYFAKTVKTTGLSFAYSISKSLVVSSAADLNAPVDVAYTPDTPLELQSTLIDVTQQHTVSLVLKDLVGSSTAEQVCVTMSMQITSPAMTAVSCATLPAFTPRAQINAVRNGSRTILTVESYITASVALDMLFEFSVLSNNTTSCNYTMSASNPNRIIVSTDSSASALVTCVFDVEAKTATPYNAFEVEVPITSESTLAANSFVMPAVEYAASITATLLSGTSPNVEFRVEAQHILSLPHTLAIQVPKNAELASSTPDCSIIDVIAGVAQFSIPSTANSIDCTFAVTYSIYPDVEERVWINIDTLATHLTLPVLAIPASKISLIILTLRQSAVGLLELKIRCKATDTVLDGANAHIVAYFNTLSYSSVECTRPFDSLVGDLHFDVILSSSNQDIHCVFAANANVIGMTFGSSATASILTVHTTATVGTVAVVPTSTISASRTSPSDDLAMLTYTVTFETPVPGQYYFTLPNDITNPSATATNPSICEVQVLAGNKIQAVSKSSTFPVTCSVSVSFSPTQIPLSSHEMRLFYGDVFVAKTTVGAVYAPPVITLSMPNRTHFKIEVTSPPLSSSAINLAFTHATDPSFRVTLAADSGCILASATGLSFTPTTLTTYTRPYSFVCILRIASSVPFAANTVTATMTWSTASATLSLPPVTYDFTLLTATNIVTSGNHPSNRILSFAVSSTDPAFSSAPAFRLRLSAPAGVFRAYKLPSCTISSTMVTVDTLANNEGFDLVLTGTPSLLVDTSRPISCSFVLDNKHYLNSNNDVITFSAVNSAGTVVEATIATTPAWSVLATQLQVVVGDYNTPTTLTLKTFESGTYVISDVPYAVDVSTTAPSVTVSYDGIAKSITIVGVVSDGVTVTSVPITVTHALTTNTAGGTAKLLKAGVLLNNFDFPPAYAASTLAASLLGDKYTLSLTLTDPLVAGSNQITITFPSVVANAVLLPNQDQCLALTWTSDGVVDLTAYASSRLSPVTCLLGLYFSDPVVCDSGCPQVSVSYAPASASCALAPMALSAADVALSYTIPSPATLTGEPELFTASITFSAVNRFTSHPPLGLTFEHGAANYSQPLQCSGAEVVGVLSNSGTVNLVLPYLQGETVVVSCEMYSPLSRTSSATTSATVKYGSTVLTRTASVGPLTVGVTMSQIAAGVSFTSTVASQLRFIFPYPVTSATFSPVGCGTFTLATLEVKISASTTACSVAYVVPDHALPNTAPLFYNGFLTTYVPLPAVMAKATVTVTRRRTSDTVATQTYYNYIQFKNPGATTTVTFPYHNTLNPFIAPTNYTGPCSYNWQSSQITITLSRTATERYAIYECGVDYTIKTPVLGFGATPTALASPDGVNPVIFVTVTDTSPTYDAYPYITAPLLATVADSDLDPIVFTSSSLFIASEEPIAAALTATPITPPDYEEMVSCHSNPTRLCDIAYYKVTDAYYKAGARLQLDIMDNDIDAIRYRDCWNDIAESRIIQVYHASHPVGKDWLGIFSGRNYFG